MKTLKDSMKKRIADKHLGKEMIGVAAINAVRSCMNIGEAPKISHKTEDIVRDDHPIQGYIKFDKIFIKTTNQAIKIEIFKRKKEILIIVNEAISNLGYPHKMTEIITK